jgi:hypothetical protein
MSEHGSPLAAVLIASMFIGCSYTRDIGESAQIRTPQQRHAGAIDHFVPHISTERANRGSRVSLFVRERRGAPLGPAVLLVQGRSAAAVPSFDLDYRDYSWMVYLADAGFDVFAADLQGYGSSSRPTVMDEPCNTSADNQTKYLIPNPLRTLARPAIRIHSVASRPIGTRSTPSWHSYVRFVGSARSRLTSQVGLGVE